MQQRLLKPNRFNRFSKAVFLLVRIALDGSSASESGAVKDMLKTLDCVARAADRALLLKFN